MRPRERSLQMRIVVRLAALFAVTAMTLAGFLVWRAYDTADSLNERELSLRAEDLARYVSANGYGARLTLPKGLQKAYDDLTSPDIFAIRDGEGRIVAASPLAFGQVVQRWAATGEDAAFSGSRAWAIAVRTTTAWA